jgi:hypothetical protein
MIRSSCLLALALLWQGAAPSFAQVTPSAAPAPPAACPAISAETFKLTALRNFRVYTDPKTGDSKVEELPVPAKQTPLLKTGQILKEFNFGPASKVQIIMAPGNLDLGMHPAPYKESFLLLYGSTQLHLPDGTKIDMRPGDMITMDDVKSKTGHGGKIGPSGYIDLNIVPPN